MSYLLFSGASMIPQMLRSALISFRRHLFSTKRVVRLLGFLHRTYDENLYNARDRKKKKTKHRNQVGYAVCLYPVLETPELHPFREKNLQTLIRIELLNSKRSSQFAKL